MEAKIQAKIQEVYICQQGRTDELNNRTYDRNLSDKQMAPKYFSRSVSNRRTVMPTIDSRKQTQESKAIFKNYNMSMDFHPGVGGPYKSYSDNVDKESALFNRFNVLQKCPQVNFIPGSASDLYNNTVMASNKPMPFNLLQKEENLISFNPNECNLANDMFFNHTRQQSKDVKI